MSDDPIGLLASVVIEHQALTPALRDCPQAVLVRQIAAAIDRSTHEPAHLARLAQEFRAASDALREAVASAGKRGDAVDQLGAKRAARRGANAPNPGRPAKRQ